METFKVSPREKIEPQVIPLSVPDATAPKEWVDQILFWQLGGSDNIQTACQHLREGLSRLLVEVPALAGKLTRGTKDDPRDLTVTIEEGASVEFIFEDFSTHKDIPTYQDLQQAGFPTTGLKVPLSAPVAQKPVVEGSVTTCAKLSKLKGGASLCFGFNHVLADVWTASELERIWSLHTADASEGVAFRRHKDVTPDVDIKTRLSTPPKLNEDDRPFTPSPHLKIMPADEALIGLHKDDKAAQASMRKIVLRLLGVLADLGAEPEPRSQAVWKFTQETLALLKTAASIPNSDDSISTMDALAALFWSQIAHHERQSTKGQKVASCLFFVNIRQHLQPPIPEAYVGNVFEALFADIALSDLEAESSGLQAAAQVLRTKIKDWRPSDYERKLHKIITLPADKGINADPKVILQRQNLAFHDHSNFPSNILNWGAPLNVPARTRYFKGVLPGGAYAVFVHPRLQDGSLEVTLSCSDVMRETLGKDAAFGKYAEFLCTQTALAPGEDPAKGLGVLKWGLKGARVWRGVFGKGGS